MAPMIVVVGAGFSVYFALVLKTTHDIPLLLAEALGGAALILLFFGGFRYFSYVQVTDSGHVIDGLPDPFL